MLIECNETNGTTAIAVKTTFEDELVFTPRKSDHDESRAAEVERWLDEIGGLPS